MSEDKVTVICNQGFIFYIMNSCCNLFQNTVDVKQLQQCKARRVDIHVAKWQPAELQL